MALSLKVSECHALMISWCTRTQHPYMLVQDRRKHQGSYGQATSSSRSTPTVASVASKAREPVLDTQHRG